MGRDDLGSGIADRRFGRVVVALVIAGFVGVLAAGLTAALVMVRGQEHTAWVNHTYTVERHVAGIRLALEEMRSARRGGLLRLEGSSGATYAQARSHLEREVSEVGRLTRDNPQQQAAVTQLRLRAIELDRLFRTSLDPAAVQSPRAEQARQSVARALATLTERMLGEERRLLVERAAAQRRSVETFYSVLAGAALLLLLVAAASVLVILRYTRDLTRTRDQLRDLNSDLEGAVQVRTRDLQRANEEIQRFAYIVSHDLRSPLVNVMGFTSELEAAIKPLSALIERIEAQAPTLASPDASLAVREDLPEAIGFIRTSTHKMDWLINAILKLSREGRRAIVPERVELTPLAQAVVDGIRHIVDERGATIVIQPGMTAITTDRLALEQILSNVVENALKYLSPERTGEIRIGATRSGGRVRIAVADNGRGIDPRDHERVFDLFRRSGAQDQPGEGIGLAHVRALAYRLGGTISVASAVDQGATFTIDLPAEFIDNKGVGS